MTDLNKVVREMYQTCDEGFALRMAASKLSGQDKSDLFDQAVRKYVSVLDHENIGISIRGTLEQMAETGGLAEVKAIFGSDDKYLSLEDATLSNLAGYVDVSRLQGKEISGKHGVNVALAVSTRNTVGLGKVYTERGLLLIGDKDHHGALESYEKALKIFAELESDLAGDAKYEGARFRVACVVKGPLVDGIKNGTFEGADYLERFEKSNDLGERLSQERGNIEMYALAARVRGELLSHRAVADKNAALVDEAISHYDVAAQRYGEDVENSWAGVVLDLHRCEALAHLVTSFGNEDSVAPLQVAFDSVLNRAGFIPSHSLTSVNGERFQYVAKALDEAELTFGDQSYTAKITEMLQ